MGGLTPLMVIGAGGHGKTTISIARTAGYEVEAVIDDDPARWGTELLGIPVISPDSPLCREKKRAAIVGIGDNKVRQEMVMRFPHFEWATVIYPGAYVNPTASIGPGTLVLPGAVIGTDARVGAHCVVSAQCTIGHDTVVGDYAHLTPGVQVAGDVWIGEGVFLGLGSLVVPSVHIGEWTFVGAGSLVARDLPAGCKALGRPARPL